MPIRYRCPQCEQLLSITTRKAGQEMPCPRCGAVSVVPLEDQIGPVTSAPLSPARPDDDASVTRSLTGEPSASVTSGMTDEDQHERAHTSERLFEDSLRASRRSESSAELSQKWLAADDAAVPASSPDADQTVDEDVGGFQVRRPNPNLGELDLTSMVDVTFLLLIFFMVTASFSLQKTIEVPPPKPDQKGAAQSLTIEDLEATTIVVKIDEKNMIFVEDAPAGNPATLADVLTRVRLSTLRTEVAIDAHPDALHETVVLVIDAATEAGMQKVRIISRTGESE